MGEEGLVRLKIDGKEVTVPRGTSILEAAKRDGIEIPYFCYHPRLSLVGACRVCVVEIEGSGKLQTSCTTPVAEGMIVRTNSEKVVKARKGVLELILTNHPLDCPVCDKGGECPLQNITYKYGPAVTRYKEERRRFEKPVVLGPYILLDRERCILCYRCTHFCEEIAGHHQLGMLYIGGHMMVGIAPGVPFDSQFSGNTIELCPVGALTSHPFRFKARPWELKGTDSICPHCACGCNIILQSRDSRVLRVLSRENQEVDNGWLCDRGRFGYLFINSSERVMTPLIRKNGNLVQVSWKDALGFIAQRIKEITSNWGADSIGGIASYNCSNEDNYIFQRFMRVVVGTNNIDFRLYPVETDVVGFILEVFSKGLRLFSLRDIDDAEAILLLESDPSEGQPITELRLKKAARRNAILTVVNSKKIELSSYARYSFADISEGINGFIDTSAKAKKRLILLGEKTLGTHNRRELLEAIDLLSAKDPRGKTYIGVLLKGVNAHGALDMGVVPDYLPGYRPLSESGKFGAGLFGWQMLDAARNGRLKALYIMGADILSAQDSDYIKDALRHLELIVVQDSTMTETALRADVILPASTFAERDGTFTNTERRVQRFYRAIRPLGESRPNWEILYMLAKEFHHDFNYRSAWDVLKEISQIVPFYADMSRETLGDKGRQWQYG